MSGSAEHPHTDPMLIAALFAAVGIWCGSRHWRCGGGSNDDNSGGPWPRLPRDERSADS
jgi:hypothetical protein